jgi:hypothetical protein
MWPWEHLAIGYIVYSLSSRVLGGRPPDAVVLLALAVGSQFPDLVDKPLGWVFHVFSAGVSVAHSLLIAVPLSVLVVAVARTRRATAVGVAFAVGYLLHLPADAVYPVMLGQDPKVGFLLWPLVPAPAANPEALLPYVEALLGAFLARLASPQGVLYVTAELTLLLFALVLWIGDGGPGLRRLQVFVTPEKRR